MDDRIAIGRSVKELRESANLSQKSLAAAMRAEGWKWSQGTVWSIERGERPLTWGEGLELGEIIGFGITSAPESLIADALTYRKMAGVVKEREAESAGKTEADERRERMRDWWG